MIRLKLASVMQHVERVTLSRLMPDASFVMKKATSTLTIKEPAFQDIVILYRRKVDDAPKQDEHDEVHEKYDKVNQMLPFGHPSTHEIASSSHC